MAKRHVRIANCSGALTDPGIHMYNQASHGPVDVITGDYLAEATMAKEADNIRRGAGGGWVATALEGIQMTLPLISERRIKVIVNGGGLNPEGLASKVHSLVTEQNLNLRVAFVDGDDLMHKLPELLASGASSLPHLDSANARVTLAKDSHAFLADPENMPVVAANAYLGYRAVKKGLDSGADIIICGRVADASPVIGAAAWWYGWPESAFDKLAGALIAGHLIECSTYVTGANFAGAYRRPVSEFVDLGLPIAEVAPSGECVIILHPDLNGFVTEDTVRCQLLYELQGSVYLNSDVKADISGIRVKEVSKNRVHVSGVRGHPPPPSTKLAIFYKAGYQCEILINASGYATDHKWDVQEAQTRKKLKDWGAELDVLDFQRVGVPKANPDSQLSATTYMRIFAQSRDRSAVSKVAGAWNFNFMAHFPGMHGSLDIRTVTPLPFLGYFPAIVPQAEIKEAVHILSSSSTRERETILVGHPTVTEPLKPRDDYETTQPVSPSHFGAATTRPLGDLVLARSGDKGGNVNIGLFVQTVEQWDWLRSFMSKPRLRSIMGKDWRDWYTMERVEFPHIFAVHFVIYGPLGRGVSSSRLLDGLGKGFAEFVRAVHVPIPDAFFEPTHEKVESKL